MALAVEHEDVEALKAWGLGLWKVMERCTFCDGEPVTGTRQATSQYAKVAQR